MAEILLIQSNLQLCNTWNHNNDARNTNIIAMQLSYCKLQETLSGDYSVYTASVPTLMDHPGLTESPSLPFEEKCLSQSIFGIFGAKVWNI